jgi:hypothetical protein
MNSTFVECILFAIIAGQAVFHMMEKHWWAQERAWLLCKVLNWPTPDQGPRVSVGPEDCPDKVERPGARSEWLENDLAEEPGISDLAARSEAGYQRYVGPVRPD